MLIVIILLVSPYLWGLNGAMLIFAPLWCIGENTDFPLFPWGIYFLLGMYLSQYVKKQYLENQLKKNLALGSLVLFIIGLATIPFFPIGNYYRSGLSIIF